MYDARLAETPEELEQFLAPLVEAGVEAGTTVRIGAVELEWGDDD